MPKVLYFDTNVQQDIWRSLSVNSINWLIFHLPFALPLNNYAYQYKQLLEKNICNKTRVADYAEMMGISRVSLNKAVMREFGLSAVHLLKQLFCKR